MEYLGIDWTVIITFLGSASLLSIYTVIKIVVRISKINKSVKSLNFTQIESKKEIKANVKKDLENFRDDFNNELKLVKDKLEEVLKVNDRLTKQLREFTGIE